MSKIDTRIDTAMNRRALLGGIGGGAALALLGGGSPAFAAQVGAIGLQLYTVRELFQKDPAGTLEQVAKIGYREVEYGGGGYDAMDHAMLRRTMDRLKLTAPSIHVPYEALSTRMDAVVAMARTLGARTVILPYLTEPQRQEAAFSEILSKLNGFGTALRKAGIGFAYHNHDFEFTARSRGVPLYDRLVKETDPALMRLELDLFWAIKAGQDMKALINRLGSRLYAFHVKDMKADGNMTSVGAGTVDFGALFKLPGASGVRHFYVENDQSPAPYIPDITKSYQTLRGLRF